MVLTLIAVILLPDRRKADLAARPLPTPAARRGRAGLTNTDELLPGERLLGGCHHPAFETRLAHGSERDPVAWRPWQTGRTRRSPGRPGDIMRQFTAAISGKSSGDLQGVLRELMAAAAPDIDPFARAAPPSRRHPRRRDIVTYRVRVDLKGARPPLWRRLELSSDLLLDEVHQVIQEAFGWTDSHLHQFGSGPGLYSPETELYLCPFQVDEGETSGGRRLGHQDRAPTVRRLQLRPAGFRARKADPGRNRLRSRRPAHLAKLTVGGRPLRCLIATCRSHGM